MCTPWTHHSTGHWGQVGNFLRKDDNCTRTLVICIVWGGVPTAQARAARTQDSTDYRGARQQAPTAPTLGSFRSYTLTPELRVRLPRNPPPPPSSPAPRAFQSAPTTHGRLSTNLTYVDPLLIARPNSPLFIYALPPACQRFVPQRANSACSPKLGHILECVISCSGNVAPSHAMHWRDRYRPVQFVYKYPSLKTFNFF